MTTEQRSAMDAEFDDVARWTSDAVERLGADHAVPGACRGSASPAALDWLGNACGLAADAPLIDVGGGTGGPAAYAAQAWGVRPVVVEPAPGACRTARRLFRLPVLHASGERLPLRTASVDTAWCLGVVCTVEDKAPLMAELRRVLRPGGALGLLVLLAAAPELRGVPEGTISRPNPGSTRCWRPPGSRWSTRSPPPTSPGFPSGGRRRSTGWVPTSRPTTPEIRASSRPRSRSR